MAADLDKARELYQKAAGKGYQSAKDALQRLDGSGSGPYTYIPPKTDGPKAPPQPPKAKASEKKKKGGLFGLFKK